MVEKQKIHEREWQTLILLDACRYDYFKDVNHLEGSLTKVNTGVKSTPEWYEKNFEEEHRNTVLISSNPMPWNVDSIENIGYVKKRWDRGSDPGYVLKFIPFLPPLDQTIIHLTTPHLPFIGEDGKEFLEDISRVDREPDVYGDVTNYGRENGWDELIEYYKENIIVALDAIEKYMSLLDGKIVITSDHGECIGEEDKYDHNEGPDDILQHVPWFEVD